jgi:hypothetical protein
MTKYQIARFKRAVKRDLTKEILGPQAKNHRIAKSFGPKDEERFLPHYVTNNPWY